MFDKRWLVVGFVLVFLISGFLISEKNEKVLNAPGDCGDGVCGDDESFETCSSDCKRVLSFWGKYIDGNSLLDSADWEEYVGALIELRDLGFTHSGIRIWSSENKPDLTSARLEELRDLDLNIALQHSIGTRFLNKDEYLDGQTHASNGQDIKYFDAPGFNPHNCSGTFLNGWCEKNRGENCVDEAAWPAHDPAYDGVIWQQELALMEGILDISGITSDDILAYDMEVWGPNEDFFESCYPGAVANSVSRYSGTLEERYNQYWNYWRERGEDFAELGDDYNNPMTIFYNENLFEKKDFVSAPSGVGDYPSPVFYVLPSLSNLQKLLDGGNYRNTYVSLNILSSSSSGWNFHDWDPKITQKAGYLLKEEGVLGIVTYPGPTDRDVDLFMGHADALAKGFIEGINPGNLVEICEDGLDNDGDADVDELDCEVFSGDDDEDDEPDSEKSGTSGSGSSGGSGFEGSKDFEFNYSFNSENSSEFDLLNESSECVSDWRCGAWGNCVDGLQVRECHDWSNCGASDSPVLRRNCIETNSLILIFVVSAVLAICLMVVFILLIRKRKKDRSGFGNRTV